MKTPKQRLNLVFDLDNTLVDLNTVFKKMLLEKFNFDAAGIDYVTNDNTNGLLDRIFSEHSPEWAEHVSLYPGVELIAGTIDSYRDSFPQLDIKCYVATHRSRLPVEEATHRMLKASGLAAFIDQVFFVPSAEFPLKTEFLDNEIGVEYYLFDDFLNLANGEPLSDGRLYVMDTLPVELRPNVVVCADIIKPEGIANKLMYLFAKTAQIAE